MADTLSSQELAELKKLYKDLQNIKIPDMDKFIQAMGGVEDARKNLTQMRKEFNNLNSDVTYFAESLAKVLQEIKGQNSALGKTKSAYSSLSSIASKLKYDQDGISRLSEKELKKMQEKLGQQRQTLNLAKQLNEERIKSINNELKSSSYNPSKIAALNKERKALQDANSETTNFLKDTENGYAGLEGAINKRIQREKELQGAIGITGNVLKGLSKIPGIGGALNTEQALEDMREFAEELKDKGENVNNFGNKLKIAGKGFSTAFKGLKDSLTDPVSILTFIVTQALKANTQVVEMGKSLGKDSSTYRENIASIARNSTNINMTTANLVESYSELVKATGLAYEYNEDQLTTQTKLTKQVGLTAEEASNIARLGILNNKTSESTYNSFVKGLVASRNQLKVGIDFKATLAEAANVSGQLAANLGYNPERIAKAIVTAKAFGMTLEQVAKAGDSLLNFESSIENELKAELLTGKQLNLERARAAALSGDQVTLAEELAKNVGTSAEFSKMNVLQQRSLAEAVGMTADELGNTLKKREEAIKSGQSLAQINEEDAKKALERQTIQDKFNASILKLQDFFGNLMAGPVGQLLDVITKIVGLVSDVLQPILNVVFTPLIWAVGLLGKMEGLLKSILVVYAGIKGYQLGINIAAGIETAMMVTKLGMMGGEITYLGIKEASEGRSLATKIALYAMNLKDVVVTGAIAGYEAIKKSALVAQIAKLPALIGLKSAEAAVATEVAVATTVAAEATSFGTATAWIVGGLAAVLGAMALFKGDDIVSPGYGKRTLMSPEGAIALNDKDTVIAGTDLGGGGRNKTGGESIQAPPIDLTPMIVAINAVKASVDRLYHKDQSVHMDGRKVGTTLSQGSHKVA